MKSLIDWTEWTLEEKIELNTQNFFRSKFFEWDSKKYNIQEIDKEIKNSIDKKYTNSLKKFKKFAIKSNNED